MSFYQIFDLTNEFNILRLICGLFLLPHLYAKASDLELTYKIYDDFRLYPVKVWVFLLHRGRDRLRHRHGVCDLYALCRAHRGGVSVCGGLVGVAPQ